MRELLVFQHVPVEVLGTLDPLFRSRGISTRYVDFGRRPAARPGIDEACGLVILGGPMNVDESDRYPHLTTEIRLIRTAVERNMPVLGICLGAQLVARALGARVYPNEEKEIGWYDLFPTEAAADDPVFRHFRKVERVFQWHGDTFELPAGAVHLAASERCRNQAFRYGDRAYALQFHIEVDAALIESWLAVESYREELRGLHGGEARETLRRDTTENAPRLEQLGRTAFEAFIERFVSSDNDTSPPLHSCHAQGSVSS